MQHAYASTDTRRRIDPFGLTAAVAINAAVLAALFTAVPELSKKVPTILKLIKVAPPVEPPPLPPEPPRARPERVVDQPMPRDPVRIVDVVPLDPPVTITLDDGPVIDLPPPGGIGAGEGPAVVDPPAPPRPAAIIGATPDPRFLDRFQPDYPPAKQRMGEEGSVRVRFLIGIDGRVKAIEPVGAVDDAFFAATRRQALTAWRFRPATQGGLAVESWQTRTVRFVLSQ